MGNGDHKVILSPEEYQMFMSSQNQGERTSLDFRVTVTQGEIIVGCVRLDNVWIRSVIAPVRSFT